MDEAWCGDERGAISKLTFFFNLFKQSIFCSIDVADVCLEVYSLRRGQRTRTRPLCPLDSFQMPPSWFDMHAQMRGVVRMIFLYSHSNVLILFVGTDDTHTVKSMVNSSRNYALCRRNPAASSTVRAMLLRRGNVCGVLEGQDKSTIGRMKHQKSGRLVDLVKEFVFLISLTLKREKYFVTSADGQ